MLVATNITHKSHDNNEGTRPPLIDEEGVMRIDNNSLEHFTTCARSAEYYLVERRHPKADRVALRFGGALHIVMELFYRDFGGRCNNYGEFIERVRAELVPYFDKFPPPPDDYRTMRYLEEAALSYLGYAEIFDHFKPVIHNGQLMIETYFEFPLGEVKFDSTYQGRHYGVIKVIWTGRIDMGIEFEAPANDPGSKWVVDHKTTTILGTNFFLEFANSSPALGYTWAMQELLGCEVKGLYLNAIALRRPSKTGVQFEVQRKRYPYDPERLTEWRYNTLILVSDFLSHLDRGYFPQEFKWCVGKYGPCKYLDVCSMPPSQRHLVLTSNSFEDVTWNPKNGTRG